MQLKLEEATQQLNECRAAHAELAASYKEVSTHYEELRRQCKGVGCLGGLGTLTGQLACCAASCRVGCGHPYRPPSSGTLCVCVCVCVSVSGANHGIGLLGGYSTV